MPLVQVTEEQVRAHLLMRDAIPLMRTLFAALRAGDAQNQPRRRLVLPNGSVLHSLAGAYGGYFGTKVYSTHPEHSAHFHFLLYDATTAQPLALFDANWLGQIRTGAASGYATDLLAPPDAAIVGIIGSGFQAASQLEAIRCVRPITEVRVWSRDPEKRARFAAEHNAIAAGSAQEAVSGAHIVITATWARDPVLESAWIGDRAHINAMGSNRATHAELPPDLIHRAEPVVVDDLEQAKVESGDLIRAQFPWDRVTQLKDLDRLPGRTGLSIFKSNGLGVEDVAAAAHIYEQLR
jgi:ornithine cyclodeaminase/alanine dehydrogenase-like protein (mu-crystallin family)